MDKLALQPQRVLSATIAPAQEVTIREVWAMLWRRRKIIYASLAIFLTLAAAALLSSTWRYRSVGEIEVQKDSISSLGLQPGGGDAPSDAVEENMILQTQAKILESDSLALRVIKELQLDKTSDYQPKWSPIGWVLGYLGPKGIADPPGGTLDESPHWRHRVLRVFHSKLRVRPVAGTRLIDVEYLSPNPQLAAEVVNHLMQGLVETGFEVRYKATMQTSSWLSKQLDDLRAQTQDLQAKVAKLRQESGVFALGEEDKDGKDQVYSPTLDKLQMATQAVSQAQSNRILKGAIYDAVKTGNPELISGLSGNAMLANSGSGVSNSLLLIQNLRLQEANLKGQLNELSAKFGPAYPKLAEARSNLKATQDAIAAEITRVGERAHNDYVVADQAERDSRKAFEEQKSQAEMLNNKTIEFQMVKQEADQTGSLYDDLLRHLKESGLLAGLRSTNISIVDPGRASDKPAKPIPLLYLFAAIAGGLVVGSVGALLREVTDNKVHDVRKVTGELGTVPLGVLPFVKKTKQIGSRSTLLPRRKVLSFPTFNDSHSLFAESLRSLRTSLMLNSDAPPRSLLITSPSAGEGKSFLSWNLAIVFAQQGKRVLLCDADLRNPRLHQALGYTPDRGLSTLLERPKETLDSSAILPVKEVPNLYLMPAGPLPGSPADLLASTSMASLLRMWETQYDLILLDAPPVLPFTDAVLLSSIADSVLLVAWHQRTQLTALQKSYRILDQVRSPESREIRIVITGARKDSADGLEDYEYRRKEVVNA